MTEILVNGTGAIPFEVEARKWVERRLANDPILQSYGASQVIQNDEMILGTQPPFILVGLSTEFDGDVEEGIITSATGVLVVRAVARTDTWDRLVVVQARILELLDAEGTERLPSGAWMLWSQFVREYRRSRDGEIRSMGGLFRLKLQAP